MLQLLWTATVAGRNVGSCLVSLAIAPVLKMSVSSLSTALSLALIP